MTAPRIYIDGTEVRYESGTLEFDRTVTQRSTARFTILDYDATDHYSRLTQCRIHDGDTGVLLWSGYLQQITEERIGTAARLRVPVTAVDGMSLLDGRLAADVFANQSAFSILETLIDDYGAPEGLRFHDYIAIVLEDEPLAYWPLDEAGVTTFRDATGNTDDGTVDGVGAVLGADTDGLIYGDPAPAATFDGSESAATEFTHTPGSNSFWFECWFQTTDANSRRLIDSYGDNTEGWFLTINNSGELELVLVNTFALAANFGSFGNVADGEKHYVVVEVNHDDDQITATLDGGFPDNSNTLSGIGHDPNTTTFDQTQPVTIGGGAGGFAGIEGTVGHVAIYSGEIDPETVPINRPDVGNLGYGAFLRTPTIETSPGTIARLVANYEQASKTIERLSDLIQFDVWVDERQVLHWKARGSADAPATIDTSIVVGESVKVQRKNSRYRNQQVVRGGVALTDTRTEDFDGDGERVTFTVAYPVAQAPTVATGDTLSDEILGDGPIVYYKCDEGSGDLADSSGNGNTATFSGFGQSYGEDDLTSEGDGAVGMSFPGDGAAFGTVLTSLADASYELWFQPSALADTNLIESGGSTTGLALGLRADGSVVGLHASDAAKVTSTTQLEVGKRYHLALTSQAGGNMVLYVNGVAEDSVSVAGDATGTDDGGFGAESGGSYAGQAIAGEDHTDAASGIYDEVAGYDVALTSTQIARHYAAGATTVGIRGVSDPEAFDWYWSKGEAQISQRDNVTPLPSGQTLSVTYIGQFPFVAISNDGGEQDRLAGLGHGTGLVAAARDVPDSTGRDEAFEIAAGQLSRWSQDHRTVQFDTRVAGFAAGQVALIDLPLHGLDGTENTQILLEDVTASVSAGGTLTYTVKGTEGPYDGRWTRYFAELVDRSAGFQEREATDDEQQIQQTSDTNESWTFTETSTSQTVNACPLLPQNVPFTVC